MWTYSGHSQLGGDQFGGIVFPTWSGSSEVLLVENGQMFDQSQRSSERPNPNVVQIESPQQKDYHFRGGDIWIDAGQKTRREEQVAKERRYKTRMKKSK